MCAHAIELLGTQHLARLIRVGVFSMRVRLVLNLNIVICERFHEGKQFMIGSGAAENDRPSLKSPHKEHLFRVANYSRNSYTHALSISLSPELICTQTPLIIAPLAHWWWWCTGTGAPHLRVARLCMFPVEPGARVVCLTSSTCAPTHTHIMKCARSHIFCV